MSSRNMRKVFGETALPPPDESSDEEPAYTKVTPSFQGLEVASDGSASEPPASSSEPDEPPPEPIKKKRNNKKKKRLAKTANAESKGLDEVEQSVLEVNQLLGVPAPAQGPAPPPAETTPPFMLLELRHMNANNEMKRLFGPEEADKEKRRNRLTNIRLLKKFIVVPLEDYVAMFKPVGLTMSVCRKADGVTYFAFDHGPEYQRVHRRFLDTAEAARGAGLFLDAVHHHHVEAMVECADHFFGMEDNTNGSEFVKQTVAYLQYVAHPSFLPVDATVRLEYAVLENRVFHVAMLKYLYLLTTKACHGTALELAKMLLNLDPADPLAVLLIVDTLALRAWQHEWLIQAVEHWTRERAGGYMFNLRYSYALAKFHVLTKDKQDVAEATGLLEDALLDFPTVCLQMLRAAGQRPDARLTAHPLYSDQAPYSTQRSLTELTKFYCQMSWSKWNEPNVMKWFVQCCVGLADKFDSQLAYKERAEAAATWRRRVYQQTPDQVHRHLCVVKPMAGLVADGAVPEVQWRRSADPRPPAATVDRYDYGKHGRGRTPTMTPLLEVALGILTSMDPRAAQPAPAQGYR